MFAENLDSFFDTQTGFADDVVVGGVIGKGLLDIPGADAFALVSGTAPTLTVIAANFPAAADGDAVTVRGVNYTVSGKPTQDLSGALLTLVLESL